MERNTIYNVDCLEGIADIPSASVNLIIADPPYFQGLTHNGTRGQFNDLVISAPFFRNLFQEFKRVCTGPIFFFCDWRGYAFYYPIFAEVLGANNLIVWDKLSGPGNKYSYNHELMILHTPAEFNYGGSAIWRVPGFSSGAKAVEGEKVHPTQKPLALISQIIERHSKPGDLILDPFMGYATTAVAAKKLGRDYVGFEISQNYFELSQHRLKK